MAFITTKEQLKQANSSVTVDLSLNSLSSFLDDAEDWFRGILGIAAMQELEGKPDENAHRKLASGIVNLALFLYADSGSMLISDSGMHVTKGESILPASDKKIVSFKRSVYKKAWACFEQCLFYLEAAGSAFPVWHSSESRNQYLSSFIATTDIFNSISSSKVSPDLFQNLRSEIRAVEWDSIRPLLGESVSDSLKGKLLEGSVLSAAERKCLEKIRYAVAPLALAALIPYLLVEISSSGIFQSSVAALSSQSDNIEAKNIPDNKALQKVMNRLVSKGESELESLRIWMNNNSDSFGGYEHQGIAPMSAINDELKDTGFYFM